MVEVEPKFPHESYNVLALLVTIFFFVWGYNAVMRFYRALLLRSAVADGRSTNLATELTSSSGDAVLIRGIGSNLSSFDGAWPMHAHAILHTRQAEPPKQIKSLVLPFSVRNIQWGTEPQLVRFDVSSAAECLVLVLLEVDVNAIRRCFGTERRNNSRKDQRTRASLQQHCSKTRAALDTYGSVLSLLSLASPPSSYAV
jgi:hypothetical protein